MNKTSTAIGLIIGVLIIILGLLLLQKPKEVASPTPAPSATPTPLPDNMTRFRSDKYGIAFVHPKNYYVTEKETGTPQRPQHSIVLVEDTQENRDIIEGRATEVREGPTTITIDIHQNFMQYNAQQWVEQDTNWTLSNKQVTQSEIASRPAVTFTWSGLYEGKSTVLSNAPYMFVVSATSLTPNDQILTDYNLLLSSIEFAS